MKWPMFSEALEHPRLWSPGELAALLMLCSVVYILTVVLVVLVLIATKGGALVALGAVLGVWWLLKKFFERRLYR